MLQAQSPTKALLQIPIKFLLQAQLQLQLQDPTQNQAIDWLQAQVLDWLLVLAQVQVQCLTLIALNTRRATIILDNDSPK